MNANERKKQRLIKLVQEELEINPYDRDMREILKDLKNSTKKNSIPLKTKEEWIATYQTMGLFPQKIGKINSGDLKKAKKFTLLFFDLKEMDAEFYKAIDKAMFKNFNEFSHYLKKYNEKVARIYLEASKVIN